ncbi:MAG: class I SAM-dependent methyltransferase [Tabrizicola sp.]|jgi:SAM-dependent methyltransferase|nr:class I SAM-dependent methyltransferase [Tabrizicola sp.]
MKTQVAHWLRRIMDEETAKMVSSWSVEALDALEISGNAWKDAGFRTYVSLEYPKFDICEPSETWSDDNAALAENAVDLVLAEQVWEHLKYPYRAGKNVLRMLRPGGRFFLSTPFLVRVHGPPDYSDCSRWTAEGMHYFLEECGFDPDGIQTFSWGNRDCAAAHIIKQKWIRFRDGLNLDNDPTYPCVVWAVAKKRS